MNTASNNSGYQDLIHELKKITGTDYSQLSEAVFHNRVEYLLGIHKLASISELKQALIQNDISPQEAAKTFSTGIYDFFRDPFYYRTLRTKILAELKSKQRISIWIPFSRNGTEAISLSIALFEERRDPGDEIYATETSHALTRHSSSFSLSQEMLQSVNSGFQKSGGKVNFQDFLYEVNDLLYFHELIYKQIRFQTVTGIAEFSTGRTFDLIQCRNALVDHSDVEKYKIFLNLSEHIRPGGFLAVGFEEAAFIMGQNNYNLTPFVSEYGVFRKNL